jgi:hypothetical protein
MGSLGTQARVAVGEELLGASTASALGPRAQSAYTKLCVQLQELPSCLRRSRRERRFVSEPAPSLEEGEQDREGDQLGADADTDERLPAADASDTASCFITALRRFETVER